MLTPTRCRRSSGRPSTDSCREAGDLHRCRWGAPQRVSCCRRLDQIVGLGTSPAQAATGASVPFSASRAAAPSPVAARAKKKAKGTPEVNLTGSGSYTATGKCIELL